MARSVSNMIVVLKTGSVQWMFEAFFVLVLKGDVSDSGTCRLNSLPPDVT